MCDTLVSLTDDGVLFAKNSDRDPNEAQVLRWYPAAVHPAGSSVRCTWIEVPQAPRTHAVVLSRPWWMWGAEMGANEHGVVIGNEAVFTDLPADEPALLGMDLVRLGLERAATADQAVSVIVDHLERFGQGGACSRERDLTYHNSFLVADPAGAVVLETAGRLWDSERVAGRGRSISNGLTIARFAAVHAEAERGRRLACARRQARTQAAADSATSVADLFAALRDHGADPAFDVSPVNGALAGPCAHAGGLVTSTQTTASWVADLRDTPLHWTTATAAPCTSLFKPVRVDGPIDLGDAEPANRFEPDVGWWRHEQLHRLALRDLPASVARFVPERDRTESEWLADPPLTSAAFALADDLERAWLRDLLDAELPDRRAPWLRREWTRVDAAAEMPVPARA